MADDRAQAAARRPDAASSLVSALANLTADKIIEDKATDLTPYGLDTPTLDVR